MGTCWATNTWATNAWATGSWANVGGGLLESLGLGDLTTAFAIWLRTVATDKNTGTRDRLAAHYSVSGGSDVSTLLAKFLQARG